MEGTSGDSHYADRKLIAFLNEAIIVLIGEIKVHENDVHEHVLLQASETLARLRGQLIEWSETESPLMYLVQKGALGLDQDYFPEEWVEEYPPEEGKSDNA